jgi:hypothetical protein
MTFQPSTGLLDVTGTVRSLMEENVQTGTTYTFALTDRSKIVAMNNSGAATVTIPADSSVAFAVGSEICLTRIGAAAVSLAAAVGVTVVGGTLPGNLASGETVVLRKRGANSWVVNQRPYSVAGTGGTLSTLGAINSHSYTTTGSSTFVVGT